MSYGLAWPALVALVASGIAAPLVLKLLVRLGSRQTISQHIGEHAHKQGTPTMGGIIILAGVCASLVFGGKGVNAGPLVLAVGYALIGFVDDFVVPRVMKGKRGLGWGQKLVLEVLIGGAALWLFGVRDAVAIAAMLFFVLFFSNAYNFSDGLDTLAGGLAVLIAIGFIAVGGQLVSAESAQMLVAIAAACVPFLVINAPPAKVFMGDVGSLPIGALFGWVFGEVFVLTARFQSTLDTAPVSVFPLVGMSIVSLVMVAELVPVPIQIGWVKLFKKRAFNFKTPIHHAFQSAGWPETRIAWLFHMVQAALVVVGFWVASLGGGR